MIDALVIFAPLWIIALSALALMFVDAFTKEGMELDLLAAGSFVVSGVLAMGVFFLGEPVELSAAVSRYLAVDQMAWFVDGLLAFSAACCSLFAGAYFKSVGGERGEFYILLALSTLGAMVLVHAVDLLSVFVGLETMSLGAYALVGFKRGSLRSLEGALKYFLLGSFAAALFLFGAALLYGAAGTTHLQTISETIASGKAQPALVLVALTLLCASLAFKVSAVPFHMWTPDAYQAATIPVTAWMSVAVKTAAFVMMIRILIGTLGHNSVIGGATGWIPIITVISTLTMIVGNFAALKQNNLKRLLAYSSIAHAGYMLLGLASAHYAGKGALAAVVFYLAAYAFSNLAVFGALIWLGWQGRDIQSWNDLSGLGKKRPIPSALLSIGVLSLMGFPPTAGFFAKYYVFRSAVAAGGWFLPLAVLGVLLSILGAYYYLRFLVYLYMRDESDAARQESQLAHNGVAVAVWFAGVCVLIFGLLPSSLVQWSVRAAESLVGQ